MPPLLLLRKPCNGALASLKDNYARRTHHCMKFSLLETMLFKGNSLMKCNVSLIPGIRQTPIASPYFGAIEAQIQDSPLVSCHTL